MTEIELEQRRANVILANLDFRNTIEAGMKAPDSETDGQADDGFDAERFIAAALPAQAPMDLNGDVVAENADSTPDINASNPNVLDCDKFRAAMRQPNAIESIAMLQGVWSRP